MRGEYDTVLNLYIWHVELPPRARRIPKDEFAGPDGRGTTSACAENTTTRPHGLSPWWNYLRVRGEYFAGVSIPPGASELPPRARRIRVGILPVRLIMGTTSACAENTYMMCRLLSSVWNYLRVRGEYSNTALKVSGSTELPPRARRIRFQPLR